MFKYLQKMLLIVALCVPWVTQAQSLGDYTFSTGTDASMWIDVPTSQTSLITPGVWVEPLQELPITLRHLVLQMPL